MAQVAITCSIFTFFSEILTTKSSLKDLHIEGINHSPLQHKTWFTTPATFGTFCLCTLDSALAKFFTL